jgi:hypothetical protein
MRRAVLLLLAGVALVLSASASAAGPPSVATSPANAITQTAATLRATVNPRALDTSYHFEYGTTAALGAATPEQPAGAGAAVPVTARITGLQPATQYFWRVVATSSGGTTPSAQRNFSTATPPGSIRIRVATSAVPYGGSTAVSGQVLGTGAGGARVALERQRFSFIEAFNQIGTTVRAAADGTFNFPSTGPLFAATHFRVVRRTGPVVASPTVTVRTRVVPGLRAEGASGGRVRLLGSMAPALVGAKVTLQRLVSSGHFSSIRSTRAQPLTAFRSRYSFTIQRRLRSSVYRVVVSPGPTTGQSKGSSRQRRVAGRRR